MLLKKCLFGHTPLWLSHSPFATYLPLLKLGLFICQFVCAFVSLTAIFCDSSLSLILCWHGEQAVGSLHSNLPSFVITCPCDTNTHAHTCTHTVVHFLKYAESGDPVTAILPKHLLISVVVPSVIYTENSCQRLWQLWKLWAGLFQSIHITLTAHSKDKLIWWQRLRPHRLIQGHLIHIKLCK